MGISNAGYSFAYILAPLLMGYVFDLFGFYKSFSLLGLVLAISSNHLIFFTPRKLRMPQKSLDQIK